MFALRAPNLLDQLLVAERALRRRAPARRVQSAARDRQQLAHHRRRIDLVDASRSTRTSHRLLAQSTLRLFLGFPSRASACAFSCRNRLSSASISDNGCAGARLTSSWPLRARYTQLASDLARHLQRTSHRRYRPSPFDHLLDRRVPKLRRVLPIWSCLHTYLHKVKHNRPRGVHFSGASSLLTYDKVVLIDPDDRELIPPSSYMAAASGIPFGIGNVVVRPMGKNIGYDERFGKTVEMCADAVRQGLVETRSTYVQPPGLDSAIVLGGAPTGGYPINPRDVLLTYRRMAADVPFLVAALKHDAGQLQRDLAVSPAIALGGTADGSIDGAPALPLVPWQGRQDPAHDRPLTQVARARIGAFIKYARYCEAKDLVPVFPSRVYGEIAAQLFSNARAVLATADEDPFWRC